MMENLKNWLYKDTEIFIEEIKRDDLQPGSRKDVRGFRSVGSYNWALKSTPKEPVIIVPGTPKILVQNTVCDLQLIKSRREQICDENRYFMNEYPIEPLFRAVLLCTPEFDFKTVGLVTDRNNLRKLFSFVENNAMESFRIDIQLIDNRMLIFVRNDEHLITTSDDYGKDFEEKYTNVASEGFGAYRQITTYKIGDIRVLCRFEVDCIDKADGSLASPIEQMSLPLETTLKFDQTANLRLIKSGNLIDEQSEKLVEMTTKAIFRGNYEFPKYKWAQLLFSNTDIMLIGWHKSGMLKKVEKLSFDKVTERCGRKTSATQMSLGKLHGLLTKIKETIISHGDSQDVFAVIYDQNRDRNSLVIFKVSNRPSFLRDELKMELFL